MKWDKIISTEQEYEKALNRLSVIFDFTPDSPEGMEAELLVTLIEKYEREIKCLRKELIKGEKSGLSNNTISDILEEAKRHAKS
ncbi:transcriptional regulator [Mongoliibacter ruber]|uniref:HTH-type transcriptional regulator/antitoxin HigA n=1 Tax=Mongoliibacter ruber TaxID=1750599 RepID=A0A2T0WK49_9BACT|nr:transcriptional regulator [Mongoliibacter ruber]PRY87045.1 hypothetical protein CLW00_107114 [Mongoliibacter ruber]